MKNIGQTVQQIRKIKGFTQSEVYSGFISRSFAFRFENGESDISATKFLAILDNLSVSPSEFKFIQNNFQQSSSETVMAAFRHAYLVQDLHQMGKLIHEYRNNANPALKRVSTIGSILLNAYHSGSIQITPDVDLLWSQMLQTKVWTISELKLANILLAIASGQKKPTVILKIMNRIKDNCYRYISDTDDPFNLSDILASAYLTVLQIELNLKAYKIAKSLINSVNTLNEQLLSWSGRISQQLTIAIWELFFGNEKRGQQIMDLLQSLENLYFPVQDKTLFDIISHRQKEASQYRQQHHSLR